MYYTESEDSRLEVSYSRIAGISQEEGQFILNMKSGRQMILEKKNFLQGKKEAFLGFIQDRMAHCPMLEGDSPEAMAETAEKENSRKNQETRRPAPRAELLESEEGFYRLYRAAEWKRVQAGREKYPFSMYLIIFLCISAAITFLNITMKDAAPPFVVYLGMEAVLALLCAGHYFLKNKETRSETALRKAARKEWRRAEKKSDGLKKELVFLDTCFKVRTDDYMTSYEYRNLNTAIASGDTLVLAGEGFSFVASVGSSSPQWKEVKKRIEKAVKAGIQEME